tara:strand:+ start:488 stop:1198 length:711 start_codon:yes stop_codon:yes gene_type:complete
MKIHENIIKKSKELSKTEIIVYLTLRRYLSARQDIPIDYVQKSLLNLSDLEMGRAIVKLIELGFFELQRDSLNDLFMEETALLTIRDLEAEKGGDEHYIYSIINTYNNSKAITPNSLAKTKVTVRFKRVLEKLSSLHAKTSQMNLVNYLADKLVEKHGVGRTADWRRQQWAIAGRLIREAKLPLRDWFAAIDYFLAQEFWDDKLNSLKQVEGNLHQFIMNRKKSANLPSTNVDVIK